MGNDQEIQGTWDQAKGKVEEGIGNVKQEIDEHDDR